MPQAEVMKSKRHFSGEARTTSHVPADIAHDAAWATYISLLSALYVLSWSIDERLISFLPQVRWIVIIAAFLVSLLRISRISRFPLSIIIFVVALGFTITVSPSIQSSIIIYLRIMGAAALALATSSLCRSSQMKVASAVLWASAVVVLGSVIAGLVVPDFAYRAVGLERYRLYGLTQHPGIVGYLAAIVASSCITIGLDARPYPWIRRIRYLIAGSSATAALLMADSRTGQIATVVAIGLGLIFNSQRGRRHIITIRTLLVSITFASIFLPIFLATDIFQFDIADDRYYYSTTGRIEIWKIGLETFWNNTIFGNGLSTTFIAGASSSNSDELFYYHSVLINYFAHSGIVGGATILVMLIMAPYQIIRFSIDVVSSMRADQGKHELLDFVMTANIATIIFASTEAALQNLYPSFLIFFLSYTISNNIKSQ